jgi:CheY-like chemotaxis protein
MDGKDRHLSANTGADQMDTIHTDVLVVDDDPGMTASLALIFKRKGLRVAVAGDGASAVAYVGEHRVRVVLMDIRMPGMDGLEAAGRIRRTCPETAVVLMTAYAVDNRIHQALAEGVTHVVPRPLDMRRVLALVEDVRRTTGDVHVVDGG